MGRGKKKKTAGDEMAPKKCTIWASRFKSKTCERFDETGDCTYGYKCMFAHGPHEIRTKEMNFRDGLITEESIKIFQQAKFAEDQFQAKREEDGTQQLAPYGTGTPQQQQQHPMQLTNLTAQHQLLQQQQHLAQLYQMAHGGGGEQQAAPMHPPQQMGSHFLQGQQQLQPPQMQQQQQQQVYESNPQNHRVSTSTTAGYLRYDGVTHGSPQMAQHQQFHGQVTPQQYQQQQQQMQMHLQNQPAMRTPMFLAPQVPPSQTGSHSQLNQSPAGQPSPMANTPQSVGPMKMDVSASPSRNYSDHQGMPPPAMSPFALVQEPVNLANGANIPQQPQQQMSSSMLSLHSITDANLQPNSHANSLMSDGSMHPNHTTPVMQDAFGESLTSNPSTTSQPQQEKRRYQPSQRSLARGAPPPGNTSVVVGSGGASSLMHVMRDDSAEVSYDGNPLTAVPPSSFTHPGVGVAQWELQEGLRASSPEVGVVMHRVRAGHMRTLSCSSNSDPEKSGLSESAFSLMQQMVSRNDQSPMANSVPPSAKSRRHDPYQLEGRRTCGASSPGGDEGTAMDSLAQSRPHQM